MRCITKNWDPKYDYLYLFFHFRGKCLVSGLSARAQPDEDGNRVMSLL